MNMDKCPGQDSVVKSYKDVEFTCLKCGNKVEIWPPALGVNCPKCGNWISRGESCADWCPLGEEGVRKCLGKERYKEWKESKKSAGQTQDKHDIKKSDPPSREATEGQDMAECCHHNCIEELRADHEKILSELDKLEADPEGYAKEFLEFTESFAEPHHQKEEQVLYPAMEEKGIPREGGPIGVMLMDHEMKRQYVKELAAGQTEAAMKIVSLMRDHISKENDILYPMAEQVLSTEELAGLGHKCEELKNKK